MKRQLKYSAFCLSIFLLQPIALIANPHLEIIRNKVIAGLLQSTVNNVHVKDLIETLGEDGTWPDINYKDLSSTGFQNSEHMTNMVELSRAYKKNWSEFRGNEKLKKVINLSLNHWLAKDYICDNWWWNQIGIPNQMVMVLLIMDGDLTEEQVAKALPIAGRADLNASGARPSGDRIQIAGILAKNALFRRDSVLFDETMKVIAGEIKFSSGPGMKFDFSFHHRTDRVTSILSYGTGYAETFAEWAALVSGTDYRFPEAAIDQLIDFYLDGICQSMIYGKYPDPGAENRGISRVGALRQKGTIVPDRLLMASKYRMSELDKIVKIRMGKVKPHLSSTRFFWESEYFSHQRPDYFASVRMFSSRNYNMEIPYNSEGLLNHHNADGSNFISRTGREYFNIFPVYDWMKIPGTTIVQKTALPPESDIQKKGLTEFVGAVTDGKMGAAAFDFKSPHDPLVARKSWFFFEEEFVCLGAGITSGANLDVATTLNQCYLKGDVTVMSGEEKTILQKGQHELKNIKWILHDSIGYIFPEPISINLSNKSETGSWFKINKQSGSPEGVISLDVFKLWFSHGNKPVNSAYQYIVVPSAGINDIESNRAIEILNNTIEIQAVKHSGLGVSQVVFYKSGKVKVSPDIEIGADNPGIVMIRSENGSIKSISVSDPTRKLARMNLTSSVKIDFKGDTFTSIWNEHEKVSHISIDLPGEVYAGKSVTINF